MSKTFVMAAALAAAPLLVAPAAHADTIAIGLQEAGVNGGALTPVASGAGGASFAGPYGSFTLNLVQGAGNPPLTTPNLLDSGTINVSALGIGTLNVYVTEVNAQTSGITGLQDFLSGFTENVLTSGWTVTEASYLDTGDTPFGLTTPLGSTTFNTIGTNTQSLTTNAGGAYSLTAVFTITANGSGEDNSTINVEVPEPASLTLLGTALVGLGLFRRRRKQV